MTDDDPTLDDVDMGAIPVDEAVAKIIAELTQVRIELQRLNAPESGDAPTVYECKRCGESVTEGDREQHARDAHNAPPGVSVEELDQFTVVE